MIISPNSRRNFLSSIAILSAGTAFAGSPFNSSLTDIISSDLRNIWSSFCKLSGAIEYTGFPEFSKNDTITETKGHHSRLGQTVFFKDESLLVQPSWIFWQTNIFKPADVVLNIYQNKLPYPRIMSLNRFELYGLLHVLKKTGDQNLLSACYNKRIGSDKAGITLSTQTRITKKLQIRHVCYCKNNIVILDEKLSS